MLKHYKATVQFNLKKDLHELVKVVLLVPIGLIFGDIKWIIYVSCLNVFHYFKMLPNNFTQKTLLHLTVYIPTMARSRRLKGY